MSRKLRAVVLAVGAWVAAAACGGGEPPPPPPTEEEIAVMTEALIVEAVLTEFSGAQREELSRRYYGQLYDAHGVDDAYLLRMRERFSTHPALWIEAVDSSVARYARYRGDALGLLTPASDGGNPPADTLPER